MQSLPVLVFQKPSAYIYCIKKITKLDLAVSEDPIPTLDKPTTTERIKEIHDYAGRAPIY